VFLILSNIDKSLHWGEKPSPKTTSQLLEFWSVKQKHATIDRSRSKKLFLVFGKAFNTLADSTIAVKSTRITETRVDRVVFENV
jgi:hypothetical protein